MDHLSALVAQQWPPERWRDVHILVAVSGGPDSMALLRALMDVRPPTARGKIYAVHVNHALRGAESDQQQIWLENQSRRLGLDFVARQANVVESASQQGDGYEAAARAIRYRLLAQIAGETGARYVAVGHTRDDQVETLLFRLIRGTGLRGLSGMRGSRPLGENATLVRPLLAASRADVLAYLARLGQAYCRDSSNDDMRFSRNRLRRELLPLLRADYNAGVDDALLRLGVQASQAQSLIEELASDLARQARWTATRGIGGFQSPRKRGGREPLLALRADLLASAHAHLAVEVWRLAWREAGLGEQSMHATHWQQLGQLTREAQGAVNLPGGLVGRNEGAWTTIRDVLADESGLS